MEEVGFEAWVFSMRREPAPYWLAPHAPASHSMNRGLSAHEHLGHHHEGALFAGSAEEVVLAELQ